MYRVRIDSKQHNDASMVFRIKQYKQCELGNHQTSETKEVETFTLRADAVRALANMLAEELTLTNVTIQIAGNGYAQVYYKYTNGDQVLNYKVVEV